MQVGYYLGLWMHLGLRRKAGQFTAGGSGADQEPHRNLMPNSLAGWSDKVNNYPWQLQVSCVNELTNTAPNIQDPIQLRERGEGQVVVEGQDAQVILEYCGSGQLDQVEAG